jgi:hypothetical protein
VLWTYENVLYPAPEALRGVRLCLPLQLTYFVTLGFFARFVRKDVVDSAVVVPHMMPVDVAVRISTLVKMVIAAHLTSLTHPVGGRGGYLGYCLESWETKGIWWYSALREWLLGLPFFRRV